MSLLSDFIEPDLNASDVLHSSGYAQAASGGVVGSGGGSASMEQRRQMMYGRQVVGSYQQSQLGQRYGAVRAKTASELRDARAKRDAEYQKRISRRGKSGFSERNQSQGSSAIGGTSGNIEKRQHFIEPPGRGYNPYG